MRRKISIIYLILIDVILVNLSFLVAILIRFDAYMPQEYYQIYINIIFSLTIIKIGIFALFKLYRSLWKYASIEELMQVITGVLISNIVLIIYLVFMKIHIPRSIYILMMMVDAIFIGGVRISYRVLRMIVNGNLRLYKNKKRVMIIGAGDAGAMVIKELKNHTELSSIPVAVIDDDYLKEGRRINGVPVYGQRCDITSIAIKKRIDDIIIAMPSASKDDIREIVEECKKTKCKTKILPGMYELIGGRANITQLRDVQIEDLLGRKQINLNIEEISSYIKGKKILVTGGGGSIGSELCRQIARFEPKELVILDIYENNAYDLQNELNLRVIIASVRDRVRMDEIMEALKPDVVFHAAAHKHVPLMEDNPKEAVKNNIFGTLNVAQAADRHGVKKFVMISTDKAVNPTNIMGASKRVCEMIIQSMDKISKTEFVAVRFGNVLGSNGSVIPLFKKQIAEGGPVTVTHPEVTRYFMTIPEASQLVIQAGSMAKGGEIFVLDMGEPVKIIDLARDLIKLSGFEPYEDIGIEIIGLRPGEKLFEELLLDGEGIESTRHEKIFIGKPIFTDFKLLKKELKELNYMVINDNDDEIMEYISRIVPTYKRNKCLKDITNNESDLLVETAVTSIS